ncbi:MAG: O-antigen ligase family protein [Chloroflexota bacterium]
MAIAVRSVDFRSSGWRVASRIAACLGAGILVGALAALVKPVVAIGGLFALGVVAGVLLLPLGRFWLLAGVIALLPFAVIPIKFGAQLTMLDVTLAFLLGLTVLRFLSRTRPGVATPLDVPILVYLGLCVVAFVLGTSFGANRETIRYFVEIVFAVLLFFAVTNGVTSRRMLRGVVDGLIAGTFASALLAVVLNLAGQPTAMRILSALGPLGYPTGGSVLRFIALTTIWRATSTSIDPNIFGGLLMVGIALFVGRLLTSGSRRALLFVPALAIMLWALLISYSRGAYVGLFAGLCFLGLIRYRKVMLPVLGLAVVVAVVALGSSTFGSHLVSGFLIEDKASAMRIGEYQDALRFISQYPWFGVGFGTTPSGTAITPNVDVYVGVSNIYLLMALEIGLVGMAGFAAVIVTLASWTWRRYRLATPTDQAWIAMVAAAFVSAAVAGLADHYFFRFPHMVALFWLLIALLVVAVRTSGQTDCPAG